MRVNDVKECDADALKGLRFFEPSRARASGWPRSRGHACRQGAGVKEGDVILAISKDKAGAPEAFRRRLRRAVAEGEAVLRVRHGKDERDVTIKFPE